MCSTSTFNGTRRSPIADVLIEKGVPFVFATGYGAPGIPAYLASSTVLQKPFRSHQLAQAIDSAVATGLRGGQ